MPENENDTESFTVTVNDEDGLIQHDVVDFVLEALADEEEIIDEVHPYHLDNNEVQGKPFILASSIISDPSPVESNLPSLSVESLRYPHYYSFASAPYYTVSHPSPTVLVPGYIVTNSNVQERLSPFQANYSAFVPIGTRSTRDDSGRLSHFFCETSLSPSHLGQSEGISGFQDEVVVVSPTFDIRQHQMIEPFLVKETFHPISHSWISSSDVSSVQSQASHGITGYVSPYSAISLSDSKVPSSFYCYSSQPMTVAGNNCCIPFLNDAADQYGSSRSNKMGNMKRKRHGHNGSTHVERTTESTASSTLRYDHDHHLYNFLPEPMSLSLSSDKRFITELQCLIRSTFFRIFALNSNADISRCKGRRGKLHIGQIGICCAFCSPQTLGTLSGSIYIPRSLDLLYSACMNMIQRHTLLKCEQVTTEVLDKYYSLVASDAKSGVSKRYWRDSASSMGLVDTPNGIRYMEARKHSFCYDGEKGEISNEVFCQDVSTASTSNVSVSGDSNAQVVSCCETDSLQDYDSACLPSDRFLTTAFTYTVVRQFKHCSFTERDRHGKRNHLSIGFPGLSCRHCSSGPTSSFACTGRFFPSTLKTLSDTQKTLNVLFNHLSKCLQCPRAILDEIKNFHISHKVERAPGDQKRFFSQVWNRIHTNKNNTTHPPASIMSTMTSMSYSSPSTHKMGETVVVY